MECCQELGVEQERIREGETVSCEAAERQKGGP